MHLEPSAVGRYDGSQIFHLFLCSLAGVREGMEVDRFDHHAPLGHHPGSDRRIDPAGQKGQTLAVGSQRQTTESSDLILVNIRFIVSNVHKQKTVRMMHIHFKNFATL